MRPYQHTFALQLVCAIAALMTGIFPSIAAAGDQDTLEAQVQARADRVAALRRDYDRTVDELEKAPELSRLAATKAKYALLEYGLLLEAQGHQVDAERLREAQRKAMEDTQKDIEPVLHTLPGVKKLEDLGRQIAAVDDDYQETRKRVVEVVAAARGVQDVGDRLAALKRRQADLETQTSKLKKAVAAQTNATLKARNEGLLATADNLLAAGRAQIAELEQSSADAAARLTSATGLDDRAAAAATAQRIGAAWNRTSRLRDQSREILWGLRDLSTTVSISGSGSVSKHTADGRDIPLDLGKPVEILPGETIRTGGDGHIMLHLLDGTCIQLRENSIFTLRNAREDDILGGGAMHVPQRLLKYLEGRPKRNTPTAVVAERGTDYVVFADGVQTVCVVLNGSVEITPNDSAVKPVIVKKLQRATLTKDGWTVESITADDYERILASFDPEVN